MIELQHLVDSLRSGEPLVVGGGTLPTTEQLENDPDGDFVVDAALLRKVLLEAAQGEITGVDPRGLQLRGAAVTGALDLASMRIAHVLSFNQCLFDEAIDLSGTEVVGRLDLAGSHLVGADAAGWSLRGVRLRVKGSVDLGYGLRSSGGLGLSEAEIDGQLDLIGALLGRSTSQWSLLAERVEIGRGIDASHVEAEGALSLSAARVGNQLRLRGARVRVRGTAEGGWSVILQNLRAESDVYADEGFEADGAVSLGGARVAGQLGMIRATIKGLSPDGSSLEAQDLRVERGVYLRDGFETAGPVNLDGAEIGGELGLRGARLMGVDEAGWSLNGRNLRVAHNATLGPDLFAAGTLLLVGARFNRLVVPHDAEPAALAEVSGWQVGDLIGRPRTDRKCASRWLEGQSTAQPWLELASFYDRIGQPSDARWMRYRSAVRTTGHGSRWSKPGRWLYRITTGHGYYAAPLTLGWLLAIFLTAWAIAASHPDDFTTATTAAIRQDVVDQQKAAGVASPPPVPGRVPASAWNDAWDTPQFQPWTYALSTAVPTTSSATSQPWTPRTGWLSAVLAVLRALSWIFTALFLAGITGLLRKQT